MSSVPHSDYGQSEIIMKISFFEILRSCGQPKMTALVPNVSARHNRKTVQSFPQGKAGSLLQYRMTRLDSSLSGLDGYEI